MKVQVRKPGRPYQWLVCLGNAEDGTVEPITGTEAEAREFVKREDAESVIGHLREHCPNLGTRIVN